MRRSQSWKLSTSRKLEGHRRREGGGAHHAPGERDENYNLHWIILRLSHTVIDIPSEKRFDSLELKRCSSFWFLCPPGKPGNTSADTPSTPKESLAESYFLTDKRLITLVKCLARQMMAPPPSTAGRLATKRKDQRRKQLFPKHGKKKATV